MLFLKWLILATIDILLLVTLLVAAPSIAAFTRQMPYGQAPYSWGWMWGTYDNPPQGDEGFVEKRCLFPGIVTGLRGYINRIDWMFRNPLYGFARKFAVNWEQSMQVQHIGNPDISDKYGVPGWYLAAVFTASWQLKAFELYCVVPYTKTKDLRVRLGWKILTSKFQSNGFAPLVNTCNPFDGYGND